MDPLKTITIYDIPDDKPDKQDVKSDIPESSAYGALNKRFREEPYIESSIPSILLKNIIYNCIPIEASDPADAPIKSEINDHTSAGSQRGDEVSGFLPETIAIGKAKKPRRRDGASDSLLVSKIATVDPIIVTKNAKSSRSNSKKSETSKSTQSASPTSLLNDYVLHVQFPMAILVFIPGRGFTVRAAGDTIKMIGIMFDSSRSYIQTPYVFYTGRDTSIQNRALTGTLGLRSLVHRYKYPKVPRIANFYTHDILFNEVADSCGGFPKKKLAIRFYDDKDAVAKIHSIQQLLLGRELHYGVSLGRTLRGLSSYVISTIDFKSKQIPAVVTLHSPKREHEIVLKLLGISEPNADRAIGIIYSTGLEELYQRLVSGSMVISDVTRQNEIIRSRRSVASISSRSRTRTIADKSRIAWREAISRREFQRPLLGLAPNELEIVTTTYERESNHANALLNNKCAHNRLYRVVMASRNTSFDTQKWIKLRELLDVSRASPATVEEIPKFDTLIPCARCKFAALCPHNYIMFEYNEKLFNGKESDDSACMRYILDTMTSKQTLSDGSYCRICGELLQRISIESESWVNLAKPSDSEPIDQLQLLIVDEVAETLNANLDLSRSSINRTNLTQSIANSISQWIRRYELKLSRVKTNTELVISFSLGLIIAIYTMMSLVHLIVLAGPSGSGITIKTIEPRGETDLKLLHTLFNGIYKLLTAQRANVIEKIIAFTPDRIKKIMTRSYGQISGAPVVIETVKTQYRMDLVTDNPYYYFLHHLWRVGELLKAPDARGLTPSKYDTVKSILGVDLDKIAESRDFFATAKMPTQWKVPVGEPAAWMNYCWKTCSQFATRLLAGTMMLDSTNTQEITKEYNTAMKTRASLIDDLDSYADGHASSRRNLGRSETMSSFGYDFEPPRDLDRIFCHNGPFIGLLHSWKIYVLSGRSGKDGVADVDYKSSDFKSLADPGSFRMLKCANCAAILCGSVAEQKQGNATLEDAMKTATRDRGFLMYYKIRCPEGMFHVFKDDACEKCGIKVKFLPDERAAYLAKYMSAYEARRKKTMAPRTKDIIENMRRAPDMVVQKKKTTPSMKAWISQNSAITSASKTWSQLPYNLLINISFGAQTHFALIISGKTNPSNKADDASWLRQANTVVSYVNMIAVSFNRFISCATRGMHPDLTEFCEKQSDAVRGLKPIDLTEFYTEQTWRAANDRPAGYANWTINQLCDTLLHVHSGSVTSEGAETVRSTVSAVSARFAEIMVDAIVESELNMSKSVVYKNIMIAASKSAIDVSGEEIEAPETDVEAKEFIKSIIDDGEEFGSSNIDIDDIAASRGDDDI